MIKASAELVSSRTVREGSVPGLSPGLVDVCLFPLYLHIIFPLLCIFLFIWWPFYKDTRHSGLEAHSTLVGSQFSK